MLTKLKSLKNHQGFMKYFKNTSWLFGEKLFSMTIALFIGIWVARYLGPEQFGLFSYAQSFVGLFIVFSTLGLDSIVVRELVKDECKSNKLLTAAFILRVFGAMSMFFILYIVLQFTSNDIGTNSLILIIASATFFRTSNVLNFYFQAKIMSKYTVYINIFSLIISSIVKIILIVTQAPLVAFAWVIVLDSITMAVGFFYVFITKSDFKSFNFKFEKYIAVKFLKDSWPLILSGLVISIYMKIDQIMIQNMLGNSEVGQYSVAVKLSEVWYFIPLLVSNSLFPAIINAKKVSEEFYYKRLQQFYDLMVWIAIAIALPITFLSDRIITLLYGVAYQESAGVLMIHIWAGLFVFLGVASSKWFVTENLQKYSFYRTLSGAIINVVLNYILIPLYGIYGAAFATLIAQFIASYFFNLTNKKLRYTFWLQTNAILLPFRKLGVQFG